MHYFSTRSDALAAYPNARWLYVDNQGANGSQRWYASQRLLKAGKRKIEEDDKTIKMVRKREKGPIVIEIFKSV